MVSSLDLRKEQADEQGVPVPAGLLYYSQLDSILRVEARPNEIRALIMARNELAAWMSKRRSLDLPHPVPKPEGETAIEDLAFLPPTIDNARECKMCYAVDSCMLYRKVRYTPRKRADGRPLIGYQSWKMTRSWSSTRKKLDILLRSMRSSSGNGMIS